MGLVYGIEIPLETTTQSKGRTDMYAYGFTKYQNWMALLMRQGTGPTIPYRSIGIESPEQPTKLATSNF
jgi:hypothetical protein